MQYKLRDWLFSRQRYWGEPFPIVYDEHGLPIGLPDSMLPVELPATVFVVLHMPTGFSSTLARILDRAGPLPARAASDGEAFAPATVLVAPPDHHLLIEDGRTRLVRGPKVNGHRPAVDVLFHSAARWYGPQVIGVVLSGALSDGSSRDR